MLGLERERNLKLGRPADVAEDVTQHAFKTGYRHVRNYPYESLQWSKEL